MFSPPPGGDAVGRGGARHTRLPSRTLPLSRPAAQTHLPAATAVDPNVLPPSGGRCRRQRGRTPHQTAELDPPPVAAGRSNSPPHSTRRRPQFFLPPPGGDAVGRGGGARHTRLPSWTLPLSRPAAQTHLPTAPAVGPNFSPPSGGDAAGRGGAHATPDCRVRPSPCCAGRPNSPRAAHTARNV